MKTTSLFLSVVFLIFIVVLYYGLKRYFPDLVSGISPDRLFQIIVLIYLGLSVYLFITDIVIKNIENRVPNGLLVFDNPTYQVEWQDFPTQYFNKFMQANIDLNVSDFYWSSSRKSYLAVGESWDFPSYDAIAKVLSKGARVINLDVYSQETGPLDTKAIPIVRDQTISSFATPLSFQKCLEVIAKEAWKYNPDYPLILYLELHPSGVSSVYNKFFLQRVGQELLNVLGDRLINKLYGFNGRNNQYTLGQVPIKNVLGKVAVISNVYPTVGVLDEIIHGVANGDQQFINLIPYSDTNKNFGGLSSTQHDKQSLIQHNYKYLSLVDPVSQLSIFNFLEPKDDLYNIPASDSWSFGCQMVLMNFQLYDQNMQDYILQFKKAGLVLKPDGLRYIAQPPPVIKQQEVPLYFGPRKLEQPGWFNQTI